MSCFQQQFSTGGFQALFSLYFVSTKWESDVKLKDKTSLHTAELHRLSIQVFNFTISFLKPMQLFVISWILRVCLFVGGVTPSCITVGHKQTTGWRADVENVWFLRMDTTEQTWSRTQEEEGKSLAKLFFKYLKCYESIFQSEVSLFSWSVYGKGSVLPHIPDTRIPQPYVTQQQHPHGGVFLDADSSNTQRCCRSQSLTGCWESRGQRSAPMRNIRKCLSCSHPLSQLCDSRGYSLFMTISCWQTGSVVCTAQWSKGPPPALKTVQHQQGLRSTLGSVILHPSSFINMFLVLEQESLTSTCSRSHLDLLPLG